MEPPQLQTDHPADADTPDQQSPAPAPHSGGISVGTILVLLMAAIIVPALMFAIVLLQRNNQAQQAMLTTLAEATAGSISETIDRQLAGMQTTLRVLATSRSFEENNLADFYRRAQQALEASQAYLILADG